MRQEPAPRRLRNGIDTVAMTSDNDQGILVEYMRNKRESRVALLCHCRAYIIFWISKRRILCMCMCIFEYTGFHSIHLILICRLLYRMWTYLKVNYANLTWMRIWAFGLYRYSFWSGALHHITLQNIVSFNMNCLMDLWIFSAFYKCICICFDYIHFTIMMRVLHIVFIRIQQTSFFQMWPAHSAVMYLWHIITILYHVTTWVLRVATTEDANGSNSLQISARNANLKKPACFLLDVRRLSFLLTIHISTVIDRSRLLRRSSDPGREKK